MQYITSFSRGTGSKTGSTHIVNPENNRKTVCGQTIMFPSPCREDVMSKTDDLMGAIAKRCCKQFAKSNREIALPPTEITHQVQIDFLEGNFYRVRER